MIRCAEESPRLCKDGSLRWYEGDTFEIEFDLHFTDDEGYPIHMNPDDKIAIVFTDTYKNEIYAHENIGTDNLHLIIDDEATKNFPVGSYWYSVRVISKYKTTIIRLNKVVVE